MWTSSLLLALLLQAPAPVQRVVVGMIDGQQVVIENPEFSGFLQGRNGDTVLIHRRQKLHGQMPATAISRIDFGPYEKGRPFTMTVTLRNGRKLELESEHQHFLTIKGATELGFVYIQHPDPISTPLRITTKAPDRSNDLTIQYLEFPAPTE